MKCIRITDGALFASLSVFPLELLAAVVAIKIAACLDLPCRIYTDCQSVEKILSQPKMLRSFSRKENLILLQIGMTDGHDIETNWIPGHPEKTIPNSDIWSKHMWGNFMADGAAAGEWDYLKWSG